MMRRRGCVQALALGALATAGLGAAGAAAADEAAPAPAARGDAAALDLFVVLRRAGSEGQRVDWLDGTSLAPRGRFTSPGPLNPHVAFSADAQGRAHAWLSTAAGDAVRLRLDAEERALARPLGGALAGLAVAADGSCVMAVHDDPPLLVFWDGALAQPLRRIAVATREGRAAAGVAAWGASAARRSFFVAPAGLPELWEISHDPRAEDFYEGLVHDFRFGEGVPTRGFLGARRTRLPRPLASSGSSASYRSLALDPGAVHVLGEAAGDAIDVVNPDVRRRVAVIDGAAVRLRGAAFAAAVAGNGAPPAPPAGPAAPLIAPLAGQAALAFIDSERWTIAARAPLPGEAVAVVAHRRTAQAMVQVRTAAGDALCVLDVQRQAVAAVRRYDGVRLGALAFSRDGQRLLVARSAADAGLQALDARTLAVLADLPGGEAVALHHGDGAF
ncbi:MAG: hypothetical protein JNL85_12280 [Rubrivivax sp.]|nr:hypothetical protein [Rubrivivax sp.]